MLRFRAERFFSLSRLLQQLVTIQPNQTDLLIDDHTREVLTPILAEVRADCEIVGLRLSVKQVDRILATLPLEATTVGHTASSFFELQNRITDEIEDSLFVQIPSGKSAFFNDGTITESLGTSLADGAFDLDEASKCLALSRNTAAAFHLMRVIELCQRRFAERLGVSIGKELSWGPILARIDEGLKRYGGPDKELHAQFLTQLIAVKNAWRNPTMHIGRFCDDGQALALYLAVRLFIDTLAPLLTSGEPTGSPDSAADLAAEPTG